MTVVTEADLMSSAWDKLTPQHRTAFSRWYAEHGRVLLADRGRGAEPVVTRKAADWTEAEVRKANERVRAGQRLSGMFPAAPSGERM